MRENFPGEGENCKPSLGLRKQKLDFAQPKLGLYIQRLGLEKSRTPHPFSDGKESFFRGPTIVNAP